MMQSFGSYSWWGNGAMLGLGGLGIVLVSIIAIVIIVLKGYALWHAAKRDERWWFIALLVLNTIGILELVYLLAVAKVKWPFGHKGGTTGPHESGSTNNNGPQANS